MEAMLLRCHGGQRQTLRCADGFLSSYFRAVVVLQSHSSSQILFQDSLKSLVKCSQSLTSSGFLHYFAHVVINLMLILFFTTQFRLSVDTIHILISAYKIFIIIYILCPFHVFQKKCGFPKVS